MMELITTVVIMVSSLTLFGYWFRYTCMLILSAKTARDFAGDVAEANRLGFLEVQSRLQAEATNLEGLRAALDRDYAVVTGLMRQTANLQLSDAFLERRMLQMHYRVSRFWYQCTHNCAPGSARKSLEEMSLVIAHFANVTGEQMAAAA